MDKTQRDDIINLVQENAELTEAVLERGAELAEVMQENAQLKERLTALEAQTGSKAPQLCDHPRHRNPGLITDCPECGAKF